MMHRVLAAWMAVLLVLPAFAADKEKKDDKGKLPDLERTKTGRPGELTPEEEDKIDRIVDRFIMFDIGRLADPKALLEFQKLGAEAIPGLIRGLNKSAGYSHSCPVTTIAKKLRQLLNQTTDEEVLIFARENIGAGLKRNPYEPLMRELKVATMFRQRQIELMKAAEQRGGSSTSPGKGSPGGKPE